MLDDNRLEFKTARGFKIVDRCIKLNLLKDADYEKALMRLAETLESDDIVTIVENSIKEEELELPKPHQSYMPAEQAASVIKALISEEFQQYH